MSQESEQTASGVSDAEIESLAKYAETAAEKVIDEAWQQHRRLSDHEKVHLLPKILEERDKQFGYSIACNRDKSLSENLFNAWKKINAETRTRTSVGRGH